MAIDAEGVQISLYSIRKTKHPHSLPNPSVQFDATIKREAQEGARRDPGELTV